MKTQYYTACSLDGFIAGPDHSLDWLMQFDSGLEAAGYPDFIRDVGALAMGSSTYEWMLRHALVSESGEAQPWPYERPVWVFSSRSLPAVDGADLRFAKGDVAAVHAEMAEVAGGKNLWLVGGGDLVGQFHDAGLLDEVIVQVAPVTLRAGAPLLPRAIVTPPMRLLSTATYGELVELRYAVGGGRSSADFAE